MASNALQSILNNNFIIDNCTDFDKINMKAQDKLTFYLGIDLTGEGLHVGHLANLVLAKKLIADGHNIIIILGGATTYIGDPSGKEKSRMMLSPEKIKQNKSSIAKDVMAILQPQNTEKLQLDYDQEIVWESKEGNIKILDNFYWLFSQKYITFLREIGTCFTVNQMLSSDTVQRRLKNNQPLSFLEFNYPILQAYDFYYLNKKYNCDVQLGGADQWINILQGVNLIKKLSPENKVFGLTIKLITRSDGKKMGKTENGAVWINPEKLSNKEYFQYFRNIPDSDVEKFLHVFTDKPQEEINAIINLPINDAKDRLAFLAVEHCRGTSAAEATLKEIKDLFNGQATTFKDVAAGVLIVDLIVNEGFASSKSEARRIIKANGVKINNVKVDDINAKTEPSLGQFILSCGKSKKQSFKVK